MKMIFRSTLFALMLAFATLPATAQFFQNSITSVGGTGTAYTGTINNATNYAALNGVIFSFVPNTNSTGAGTLAINSFINTPPPIVKPTGGGYAPLTVNDLVANQRYLITYDFPNSQWEIVSPIPNGSVVGLPQGYLTPCQVSAGSPVSGCSAGVLVPTGEVGAVGTLFYEPAFGSSIPIYNGSTFVIFQFGELGLTIPSSRLANTIYDVYIIDNGGVVTACIGPAWTTSTVGSGNRGAGAGTAQISQINGVWTNAVAMSCVNQSSTYSVPANEGTHVGTILINSVGGQITLNKNWGQSRQWGLWNRYNRQEITLQAGDSTGTWSYTSGTIRASNGTAANSLTVLTGDYLDPPVVTFTERGVASVAPANSGGGNFGIGVNGGTSFAGVAGNFQASVPAYSGSGSITISVGASAQAQYFPPPSLGAETYGALEQAITANGFTASGGVNNMILQATWRG
jgi:hypothetical protein